MNIPESAIRPFEPLGIPTLHRESYASILKALDKAFNIMDELGEENEEPMNTEGIELFLMGCLKDKGARTIRVIITQFCHNECDISVYYMTKRTRNLERYNCVVHSNAGFTHVSSLFGAE